MAQFELNFVQDLMQRIGIRHCETMVFTKDNLSDAIRVALYVGEEPYSGGGTVSATAVRSDGITVPITNGSITGNVVTVYLTEAAVDVPGNVGLYVKLTSGDTRTTVLAAIFAAQRTETDSTIDPGTIIPSVTDLINAIDEAVDSIPPDFASLLAGIAPVFSASTSYEAGAFVWEEGVLYRFTTAHPAGSWTGTDVVTASMGADFADEISDLKSAVVDIDKVTELTSYQLMDEAAYTHGAVLDDGTISISGSWNGYDTSDYIPVKQGVTYSIYFADANGKINTAKRTIYLLCDIAKVPYYHNNIGSPTDAVVEVTPAQTGFIRICSSTQTFHTELIMIEGTVTKPYAKYGKEFVDGISFNAEQVSAIEEIANRDISDKTLTIIKSGNDITLENAFGADVLRRTMTLSENVRNNATNFGNVYIVKNGVATRIKDCTDDIAPQRIKIYNNNNATEQTVGANHGWDGLRIPAADHELTNADAGSVWTDGTTQYVLWRVNDTYAMFLFPCTKSSYELYFEKTMPVASLTHVSGATHTNAIPITNAVKGAVYPSTSHTVTVQIDGKEISGDGQFNGKMLVISEQSNIMDYTDMIAWQKTHIGNTSLTNIASYMQVFNNYIITDNSVVVEQSIRRLNSCEIRNSGILQATSLEQNGGTIYGYLNNVTSGTFASSDFVNMNSYNTDTNVGSDNITGTNIPDRVVEYHDVDGTVDYGFTMGYIPDIADSSNAARDDNALFFDMRSTKKIYPVCFYQTQKSGDYLTGIGYRVYFPATAKENKNTVRIGDTLYVFADKKGNSSFWRIPIPAEFAGCAITNVYENGLTKINGYVDGAGLALKCSSGYGCAVYKISK